MIHQELHHVKLYNFVRGWLEARDYTQALKALEFARKRHVGKRKDGLTPEFTHQLHIVRFLINLSKLLKRPERVITLALLHDTTEDGYASNEEILLIFGKDICNGTKLLSKVIDSKKLDLQTYLLLLLEDEDCVIVKGFDRMHNLESMRDAFTLVKQVSYAKETEDQFLPFLKEARLKYPDHKEVLSLLRQTLTMYKNFVFEMNKHVVAK